MVTDLYRHLTNDSRGAWHTVYAMLLSNYKRDATWSLTIEKFFFLRSIIHSQAIQFTILPQMKTPLTQESNKHTDKDNNKGENLCHDHLCFKRK